MFSFRANAKKTSNPLIRSRAWVGTLNNPTAEDREYFGKLPLEQISWIIIGDEHGEEKGTEHLQMACRFNKCVPASLARDVFGRNRAHIEVMKGSIESNVKYCSKEKLLMERGVRPAEKGGEAKAKLEAMVEQIKEGTGDREMFEANPAMWLRLISV